jgi:predicted DNA-binding transcriptional regulator YafY
MIRHLRDLRNAASQQHKVRIDYRDPHGRETTRVIRPLCLAFWGPAWTAGAYCELRQDFRNFRLDRIEAIEVLKERFELQPPITLEDYLRAVE